MPGARLFCYDVDRDFQLTQYRTWLHSAAGNFHFPEGRKKLLSVISSLHNLEHRTHTNTRHEDDQVVAALKQIRCKFQHMLVRVKSDLTHCRDNNRFPAIRPYQFLDLFRAARLQRKYTKSIEARMRHASSRPGLLRSQPPLLVNASLQTKRPVKTVHPEK